MIAKHSGLPRFTKNPPRKAELKARAELRCHWVEDLTADSDSHRFGRWFLVPGCATVFNDPDADCTCDTIDAKRHSMAGQLRDQAASISHLRRNVRAWRAAAGEAYAALTGSAFPFEIVDQPGRLAGAARRRRPRVPDDDTIAADRDRLAALVAGYARSTVMYSQDRPPYGVVAEVARVRELCHGRPGDDTITVAELWRALDGATFTPARHESSRQGSAL